MTAHADFAATVTDLFAQALRGPVQCKRMFGGYGFYHDQRFFAVMVAGTLYLKVNDATRPVFEAEGLPVWVYQREGKPVTMGFYGVPESVFDDPDEMLPWVRLALQAAHVVAKLPAVSKTRAQTARKSRGTVK